MIAIIINAVVITLLYFPEFKENHLLVTIDYWFVVLYLLEAIVKLHYLKPRQYFSSNWNRFDFFIVVMSLPSLLIHVIPLMDVSLLLILRLFRLVRLVRFIKFVPHLERIIAGLGRALKASVFVFVILLFFNFMLAIFTCHFYGDTVPEYFGNPLLSAYSIFQMFTVEGWNEIPATIAGKMADPNPFLIGLMRFYFVLIVLLGGILGMSLANAVFVDEMTMDNTDELEAKIDNLQEQLSDLRRFLENKIKQ